MTNTHLEPGRWDLSDLLPSPDASDQVLADLERLVSDMEALRDRLSADLPEEDFLDAIRRYEAITRALARLGGYAYLGFAEDTQNQQALTFLSHMEQLSADTQNRILFFDLWWKALDDEPARRLMGNAGDYRYFLESLRRFKPHTLSELEEQIINLKDVNGASALVTLYDMITNRFAFELEVDGIHRLSYARPPTRSCTASTAITATCWARFTTTGCETGATRTCACATSPRPSPCATWPTTFPTWL
jgi:oligoendopeptidase F